MSRKNIIEELLEEKKHLEQIIKDAQSRLKHAPEGKVRCIRHGKNGVQFYLLNKPGNRVGTYMPASQQRTAVGLLQKRYDQLVLRAANKQLAVIDRFLKGYDNSLIRSIYASMSAVRKPFITPAELPDKEYAAEWQACKFEPKHIPENVPKHYTDKGEQVRSKSEVMIANALNHAGIPYRYECPLHLDSITVHPDFTILRIEDRKVLYWEHLGRMDDPGYCSDTLLKIRSYEDSGLFPGTDLILTMETGSMPINLSVIKRIIRQYCV